MASRIMVMALSQKPRLVKAKFKSAYLELVILAQV